MKFESGLIVELKDKNEYIYCHREHCRGLIGKTHQKNGNQGFVKWYRTIEDCKNNENMITDNGWWELDELKIIDRNKEGRINNLQKQINALQNKIRQIEEE